MNAIKSPSLGMEKNRRDDVASDVDEGLLLPLLLRPLLNDRTE